MGKIIDVCLSEQKGVQKSTPFKIFSPHPCFQGLFLRILQELEL